MEEFIVFIVIAVIISAVVSASKGGKKTGGSYRPPQNTQFPDMDATRLQEAYWNANAARASVQQPDSMEMQTAQEMVHSCEEDPEDIAPHDVDRLEERRIDSDLSQLKEELRQLNDDLKHKKELANAYALSDYTANRLKLFHDQNEVVKALIYAEVMQPKFKGGRAR